MSAITTLPELWDALQAHDWFHEMSDDHSVWRRGTSDWSRIQGAAAQIEGGKELCTAFTKHHYSGPPWNTPKAPKPERPQ